MTPQQALNPDELKACPFCGRPPTMETPVTLTHTEIKCVPCHLRLIDSTERKATKLWNTRALSLPPDGWRGMDTCPRDGTPFLVCSIRDVEDGDYSVETLAVKDWDDEKHRFWNLNSGNFSRSDWWTHWMPLPEAPQETGDARG